MTSSSPANIHDAFFKALMSEPATAGRFLRERLPPPVAALLADTPPELLPGSFIDEDLAQHHSDLLFRCALRDGQTALAYVLIEHKSAPDPWVGLQLLRYMTRIWDDHLRQGKARPLPPILPLVVYHGVRPWSVPAEFQALFGAVPDVLHRYLPQFVHALSDLGRIDDTDLSGEVRLRAFLKTLKYILRPDLPNLLHVVVADFTELAPMDIVRVLAYINRGPIQLTLDDLKAALPPLEADRMTAIYGHFSQPFFDQGLSIGREQGMIDGIMAEKRRTLEKLLTRRFGPASVEHTDRIAAADLPTLDRWIDAAIDASDIASVFTPS